jgi:glycosyltransferase involved in cell wall biosynthesis
MPLVSVIIPCYNEQATIRLMLEGLHRQNYPLGEMEVILADGMSSDATRVEVTRFQADYPDLSVRLVDNPKRNIPSGLNRALEAAQGEFIVRLDAHAVPAEDYIACSVAALQKGEGENVGGVWEIRPGASGWVARAIAAAAAHPLGVGDALYRFTSQAAYVDTVPFGAFRRETLNRLGGYDENLLTNEDYELNARLRAQGGRIRLDPRIRSGYFARSTFGGLVRQYFRYGFWKWQMLRRYPGTLRWRQALPPLFVLGLVGLLLLSPFWNLARILLVSGIGVYLFALCAGSLPVAIKKRDPLLAVGMPLAMSAMHLSWGFGFLISVLRGNKR